MKIIEIPADIAVSMNGQPNPVTFRKSLIAVLLDNAAVFGTRKGARRSVSIERIFEKAGGSAALDNEDHAMLAAALEEFGQNWRSGGLVWSPPVAKAMELAGWFDLIENPKTVETPKDSKKEA